MQINELVTQRLDEAGMMDYLRAAASTDPALTKLPLAQRAAAMQRSKAVSQIGQATLQRWQQKVIDLTRANQNQPITDQEYTDNLKTFIETTLLQKGLTTLDQNSRQRMGQAINAVVAARDDQRQLASTFQNLVTITTAARQDPTRQYKMAGQRRAAPAAVPAAASAASPAPATTTTTVNPAALKNTLANLGVDIKPSRSAIQQVMSKAGANLNIKRTGDPYADALLTLFGFNPQ